MPTNILMPALSPTMTEGTLARWLKKEGEQVKAGDIIAEIETDKATMEVEAVDEGVLSKILIPDGTANVKVNDPIGVLTEAGESSAPAAEGRGEGKPPAPPKTPDAPVSVAAQTPPPPPPAAAAAPLTNGHDATRVFASPLARRMAKQAGIDLSSLQGSGPNGRIIRADIDKANAAPSPLGEGRGEGKPQAHPQTAPLQTQPPPTQTPQIQTPQIQTPGSAPKPPIGTTASVVVPHSTMRRVIGRRLLDSHQSIPNFFVTLDIEIDALLKLRTELNAKSPKDGPAAYKLSVNDLVIKAAAATLRRIPKMNASYTDEGMVLYDDVDISIAVSIPDGLITPIIRRADQKGLATISAEMKDKGARAKSGSLKPEEFQGGTFSISNLGMFGTKQFTAIINPPQAAILAVGAGEKRPVVRNDALAIATVMTCTLSVDHRVADGALGAEWMATFKAFMEDPLSLML